MTKDEIFLLYPTSRPVCRVFSFAISVTLPDEANEKVKVYFDPQLINNGDIEP